MNYTGRTVDLPLFASCVFLIVVISQILGALLPLNVYFSFRSFLLNDMGSYRYVALAVKLAIPLLSGALVMLLFSRVLSVSFDSRLKFYTLIKDSLGLTLFSAGFFSGLLQAWPQIAYWDIFADPRVLDYKFFFFVAYGLYFIAFGYFALVGGLLCLGLLQRSGTNLYFPGRESVVKFATIARNGALGFIATGLGTSIVELLPQLKLGPGSS